MIRSHINSRSLDNGQKSPNKYIGQTNLETKYKKMYSGIEKRINQLTGQLKLYKRKFRKRRNNFDNGNGADQDPSKKQKREEYFLNLKKRTKCHYSNPSRQRSKQSLLL
mmetsp:Transcript_34678/g.48309  ORF Transcript_34678/g.48309 Transcript_34678/m.48309 type:complete len:109 (-) Transcript_34678:675-1001(-)